MASDVKPVNNIPVDIRQFVGTYMGKTFKQYARELFTNIRLVDLCVKPSYLLDYGMDDVEKLVSLLKEMKHRTYITNNLNVLRLDMDIIIINPATIKKIQNQSSKLESKFTIVDVSKTRGSPEVMCKSCQVFDQLKQIIDCVLPDCEHTRQLTVDCRSANLTTIFGVLLGYPVVYWFDNEDGLMANCLDMEPLESFRVIGQRHDDESEHCVYSFSVPKCVLGNLRDQVMEWFKVIHDDTEWKQVLRDFTLIHTTVELDTVAL
ncbi:UPF0739 protein C1orf74 homolog [Pecten maximus]|uniref:UPF0739 protein C1orf74 homolog n=1 Tax=Pecten maximus TaxID=6579 RepID=UPI00145911F2|nr:UPF0739 protein C1orf74 homolog [Pecten maximus]